MFHFQGNKIQRARRHLSWLALLLPIALCSYLGYEYWQMTYSSVTVRNESGHMLQGVTVSTEGNDNHLANLPAGDSVSARVHPGGRQWAELTICGANGQPINTEDLYIEDDGYHAVLVVKPDNSIKVESPM